MNIEKANVIDNDDVFIVTYKVTINDTESKEEQVVEPFLTAMRKHENFDSSITYRNQINRIPITIFK
jgi:hypothetical protein